MLLLRTCAKIFFLNEIEACQVYLFLKNLGWSPSSTVLDNMSAFSPPSIILKTFLSEKLVQIGPILVHLMVLCYTAKKLLNKDHVTYVIQHFIELNCFPGFGQLFNLWIIRNENHCVVNIKKINKIHATILREPKTYSFPERQMTSQQRYLEYKAPPAIETLFEFHVSKTGSHHGTRKNSMTPTEMSIPELDHINLTSKPAFMQEMSARYLKTFCWLAMTYQCCDIQHPETVNTKTRLV